MIKKSCQVKHNCPTTGISVRGTWPMGIWEDPGSGFSCSTWLQLLWPFLRRFFPREPRLRSCQFRRLLFPVLVSQAIAVPLPLRRKFQDPPRLVVLLLWTASTAQWWRWRNRCAGRCRGSVKPGKSGKSTPRLRSGRTPSLSSRERWSHKCQCPRCSRLRSAHKSATTKRASDLPTKNKKWN